MPRTAAKTTQADIARAIRAVKQTGGGYGVKVNLDGTILIFPFNVEIHTPQKSVDVEPLPCM